MKKNISQQIQDLKNRFFQEIESDWAKLNEKIVQASKIDPEYIPPWQNKQTGDCRMIGFKSLKELLVEIISDNAEQRLGAAQLQELLVKRGYKKYTYSYVYNVLWYLIKKDEVVNGFKLVKIQPDGEKPSYYKVKVKVKKNAEYGVQV